MEYSRMRSPRKMKTGQLSLSSAPGVISVTVSIMFSFAVTPQKGWAALAAEPQLSEETNSAKVEFNSAFIHGAAVDVSRFSEGNFVEPGTYPAMVRVNNDMRGKYNIRFIAVPGKTSAHACFSLSELKALGIQLGPSEEKLLGNKTASESDDCFALEKIITGSSVSYNAGDYELSIIVPQINQVQFPRGYIDPSLWDAGVPVGFLDYNANVYGLYSGSTRYSENSKTDYSSNFGVLAGLNAGEWRLRKRLNTNWSNHQGMHNQSLYGYAQTDITPLRSQLTLGDSNTRGEIFDSFGLRGVQLQSDERMLPEGIRTYVPVLRGVAETNAKVRVTQRGQTLYEIVVPPGPFELTDVGAMGYGGDLQLIITESDGRERIQSIPFSAPPMLLHEGVSLFGFSAGEMKDAGLKNKPKILQGEYQYGLANLYTLYGGLQISENYHAFAIGNAFNTPLGGISLDGTHAWSDLANNDSAEGSSFRIGYSKFVEPTNTNLMLAAYRYSTRGYYSFREATQKREGVQDGRYGLDYRTRQRLTLSMGQALWNGAHLNLSSSMYNYWDGRTSYKQYSLSYNKSERYFSYSISASRARNNDGNNLNTFMFTVSVPIGSSVNNKPVFSSLYSTFTHDNAGTSTLQVNANGSRGDSNELNYGIGTSAGKYTSRNWQESVTGNINYRSSYGQVGMTASANNRSSRQLSLMANGSLVAHRGGMTVGPQLGDSAFAIVDVPGGEGARLLNGYGSTIDSNGYAIMPSLTPYRKNVVSVDAKNLPNTIDVMESESTVVPRTGSAVFVSMKTIIGAPAILTVRNSNKAFFPIGTELVDAEGVTQGIVAQGGKAFVRGWNPTENDLFIKDDGKTNCKIVPDSGLKKMPKEKEDEIVQLEVTCIRP